MQLVQKLNKPFREAHKISGKLVKLAEKKKLNLEKLSLKDMQNVESGITEDIFSSLNIQVALGNKRSFGGPAPRNVKLACARARRKYLNQNEDEFMNLTQRKRVMILVFFVCIMTVPILSSCGKRGKVQPPTGHNTEFPKKYPSY